MQKQLISFAQVA